MCGMVGCSRHQRGWAAHQQSPGMLLGAHLLYTGAPMQKHLPDGLDN